MSAPFRQRNALHTWQTHFGPNMTPMVDVVMVILVFFMASTALVGPEWILRAQVAPESRAAPPSFTLGPAELLVVLVPSPDGVLVSGLGLDRQSIDALAGAATTAAQSLGAAVAHTRIIIEPESSVSYDAIVRVQEMLVDAGFRDVALR